MSRYRRPCFDFDMTKFQAMPAARQNSTLFDWWCDEHDHDALISALGGAPLQFKTCAPRQDDPAPPIGTPAPQGFRDAWMLSSPADIDLALKNADLFSNIPYAALGSGSFLLGQDPDPADPRHAEQVAFVQLALKDYTDNEDWLKLFAKAAVKQAALTSLARPDFDLAAFAEQAALRYLGILFGYGFQDHALLEDAARAAYRALQYIAVGQHFTAEPGVVPAAQQAVGRLVSRTSELIDEYSRLERSPRRFGTPDCRDWPTSVQPWGDLGLRGLGEPLLKRMNKLDSPLSGRDRALVCSMLLAGTLGNIQSAVCLAVQEQLRCPGGVRRALVDVFRILRPVTVLPRRTGEQEVRLSDGQKIPPGTDCLILLEGGLVAEANRLKTCPHAWGQSWEAGNAVHPCLGKGLSWPLIDAVVQHTLDLPGLTPAFDPLTSEVLGIERLWGFACTRYPMRYDRERTRQQHNLIVSMQVKAPIAQNSAALRRLLAASVPRVEAVLTAFEGVHFAWFEFSADDSQLVLRTIYDGQFEPYVRHFAVRAGDLFDGLFEYLEDAPPRPVAEHPDDFVETIRRFNRAPLAAYLYSAYPGVTVPQVRNAGSVG